MHLTSASVFTLQWQQHPRNLWKIENKSVFSEQLANVIVNSHSKAWTHKKHWICKKENFKWQSTQHSGLKQKGNKLIFMDRSPYWKKYQFLQNGSGRERCRPHRSPWGTDIRKGTPKSALMILEGKRLWKQRTGPAWMLAVILGMDSRSKMTDAEGQRKE